MVVERRWQVPLADVEVDEEIITAARETIASGWWSMGPAVAAFEEAFARYCGSRYAVALSSGTAALHLALLATECGPGDEVIVPSLTFVAAANTIVRCGATPVFCDIAGVRDVNLDPRDAEAAITARTKAIVVLHYGGFPCNLDAVREIADRHGLAVIEDAAHAPGAEWKGKKCGSVGIAGCFSFFSNKNLPVGEGGMLVTDDGEIAERARLLRSHGMTTLTWDRHRGHAHTYDVVLAGLNYRLDEVRAAIGLVQLARLEEANEARARLFTTYRELLDGVEGIGIPFGEPDVRGVSAHHLAVVLLPAGTDRPAVRGALEEQGIQTSVHYPPIHRFAAYVDLGRERPLPRTEAVAERLLTLPLFPTLQEEQVETVAARLLDAIVATRPRSE